MKDNQTYVMSESERTEFKECAKDHRQLAEWLKGLKAVWNFNVKAWMPLPEPYKESEDENKE